jgi:hypothetical protein
MRLKISIGLRMRICSDKKEGLVPRRGTRRMIILLN